jgi:hypothetical protein
MNGDEVYGVWQNDQCRNESRTQLQQIPGTESSSRKTVQWLLDWFVNSYCAEANQIINKPKIRKCNLEQNFNSPSDIEALARLTGWQNVTRYSILRTNSIEKEDVSKLVRTQKVLRMQKSTNLSLNSVKSNAANHLNPL